MCAICKKLNKSWYRRSSALFRKFFFYFSKSGRGEERCGSTDLIMVGLLICSFWGYFLFLHVCVYTFVNTNSSCRKVPFSIHVIRQLRFSALAHVAHSDDKWDWSTILRCHFQTPLFFSLPFSFPRPTDCRQLGSCVNLRIHWLFVNHWCPPIPWTN